MSAASTYYAGGGRQRQRTGLVLDGQSTYLELGNPNRLVSGNVFWLELGARITNLNTPSGYRCLARNSTPQGSAWYQLAFTQISGATAVLSWGLFRLDLNDFQSMDTVIQVADFQGKAMAYMAGCDGSTLYLYVKPADGPLRLLGSQPWTSAVYVPGDGNLVGTVATGQGPIAGTYIGGELYYARYWSVNRTPADLDRFALRQLPRPELLSGLEVYHKLTDPPGTTLVGSSSPYGGLGTIYNGSISALTSPIRY